MEQLYYKTPYIKHFTGTVLACGQNKKGFYEIELDRTAFYPEGGGQPSDTGILGTVNVLSVHEREGRVIHETDGPLEPGREYEGVLDWEKRYDNMQLHSGEHIVSGLIHQLYGHDNVGFHMGSEEVTLDLNGVLDADQLRIIELEANRLVYENLPVEITYPSGEELLSLQYRSKKELSGQVRIVSIPGADCCACCGTHVMRTGEIGLIKFLSMISYKGGVRISMLCGRKALEDYHLRQEAVTKVSNLLSAKPFEIPEAVEKLKRDLVDREVALNQAVLKLFACRCDSLSDREEEPLFLLEQDLNPNQLRIFCTMLVEQGKGSTVLVCSKSGDTSYQYALGSRHRDMKLLCKSLNQSLNGRGGGSAQLAQGTFFCDGEEIKSRFMEGCLV